MQQLHYASQYEILGSKVVMFPIAMTVLEFSAQKYETDQIFGVPDFCAEVNMVKHVIQDRSKVIIEKSRITVGYNST